MEDQVKDNTETTSEKITDELSEDFEVNLPGKDLPTPVRFIAFFSFIGGLSIMGSLFADIVKPQGEDVVFYILRIAVGLIAMVIAYGIVKKQRWSIWLYALVALIAFFTNPFLSFIPGLVVVYLFTQRHIFSPSIIDLWISVGINRFISLFKARPPQP